MGDSSGLVVMGRWYEKAQIDYAQLYMSLYAAFNTWYRMRTNTTNDRRAINALRDDTTFWSEYEKSETTYQMQQVMLRLAELTQREPISYATPHWRGVIENGKDWPSLLEYWYRVRCLVMHGAEIRSVYIYLAYETLNVFMTKIMQSPHD